jgi:hypothetical protein
MAIGDDQALVGDYGVGSEDTLDGLEELRFSVPALAVVNRQCLGLTAASTGPGLALEIAPNVGVRLPPLEARFPQRRHGRRFIVNRALLDAEVVGVVRSEYAGLEVDRAVSAIEDERVRVELLMVNKYAGDAAGQTD